MADTQDLTEIALISSSAKWGMGGGTVTSIFGCLSQNELLVFLGILTTIGGFVVNLVFQWRRDKRAKEEHELTKQLLETQIKNAAK